MHTIGIRKQAFELRKKGYSYSYISKHTGLSKSTLSDWLAAELYTPNEETIEKIGKARAISIQKAIQKKQMSFQTAKNIAQKEIKSVSRRDLFMFGLGLYLGEGAKTADIVRVVNADPRVIKISIEWFKLLGVTTEQFAPRLHLYPDSSIEECLQFWSLETTIPISQFQKSSIDWRTNKKAIKHGKLPYGTLHLGIRALGRPDYGSFFSRKILALIEGAYEKIIAGVV
ncbi:MAG TPA: helix-turn-helix transcriptional regulator [Candidatus Paceibacterota bacterium]